jgi:7,8-dihydro-6-hydroxymethylpterin-pyrophosphokinase
LAWVEQQLQRKRTADQNAPRTIDADITLFNEDVFDLDETHHIPDPDLLRYPHVSIPIAELLPSMLHPETKEPLQELSTRLTENAALKGNQAPQRRPKVKL